MTAATRGGGGVRPATGTRVPAPGAGPRGSRDRVPGRAPGPGAGHHGSHNHLLDRDPEPVTPADVDAIIVPTARPAAYLEAVLDLAARLRCPLVVLCSGYARAADAAARAAGRDVDLVAVDVTGASALPALSTSALLAGTRFHLPADTSHKRNLGLALARMMGWARLVFLDDDIRIERIDDLREAAGLLATHDAVGLANAGYPDNSVVCHAYRRVGGAQDSFVGGGALAVPATRTDSFFPNIYNEDWFYLLGGGTRLARVAVTGKAVQQPYDPFRDPRRARAQELGDCLGEGVFALLDDGGEIGHADVAYWRRYLGQRDRFVNEVLRLVGAGWPDPSERSRVEAALKAARGRLTQVTPELCVQYLARWQQDRLRWASFARRLPHRREIGSALARLGLAAAQPASSPAASRRSTVSVPAASTARAAGYASPAGRSAIAALSGEPR